MKGISEDTVIEKTVSAEFETDFDEGAVNVEGDVSASSERATINEQDPMSTRYLRSVDNALNIFKNWYSPQMREYLATIRVKWQAYLRSLRKIG